jgi:hypothetical protein
MNFEHPDSGSHSSSTPKQNLKWVVPVTLGIYDRKQHVLQDILVGGIPTRLKDMSSSVEIILPDIWKKNMFQTTNQYCTYNIQNRTSYDTLCLSVSRG